MLSYIIGRLVGLISVLFLVSLVAFVLMHSIPGGPFDEAQMPQPPAAKANILAKYGLDKPLYTGVRKCWFSVKWRTGVPR